MNEITVSKCDPDEMAAASVVAQRLADLCVRDFQKHGVSHRQGVLAMHLLLAGAQQTVGIYISERTNKP